jgi:hypothetical protein
MTGHGCGKALVARHRVTSYANSIKLSHPPPLTWASRSRTAAARNLSSAGGCLGWRRKGVSMTEHAGLIQVTTFRPTPDDAMKCWPCAPKPKSAPPRPTAASGHRLARWTTIRKPWWQSPGGAAGTAWRHSSKRPLLLKPGIALFAAPVHAAYVGGLGECVGVGDGQRGRREIGARQIDLIVRL